MKFEAPKSTKETHRKSLQHIQILWQLEGHIEIGGKWTVSSCIYCCRVACVVSLVNHFRREMRQIQISKFGISI